MSWTKINDAHKVRYDRDYVACHVPEELEYLRVLITIHFPSLRKAKVTRALNQICGKIQSPCDRSIFLQEVEQLLTVEITPVVKRHLINDR